MTEKKITVGIIQQQNTGDIADNKKRLKQHIEDIAWLRNVTNHVVE